MWTKICANTSLNDAQHAAAAGASAVGFVFAPSPRRVTPAQVASIAPHLPRNVERIGVFVEAGLEEILETVQESDLTGIQLHVSHDPELPGRLRERMASVGGSRLRVLSVLPFSEDMEGAIRAVERDAAVDALLIDSRTAAAHGGTGQTFDWQAAQALLRAVSSRLRLVVAGGLGPENVAEAIHRLRPWGVDVASGVEAAPGRKDPARVAGFLRVARQAFGEIERGGASQG